MTLSKGGTPGDHPVSKAEPRSAGRVNGAAGAERGVALIAVLWVMVVLAALAASFSTSTRTQVNLARNIAEAAKAEAIADAAVSRAAAGLIVPIEEGGLRTDETIYAFEFAGGEARFAISDEGGKVDLNAASRTLLRDLFEVVGVDPGVANALADEILAFRGDGSIDDFGGGTGAGETYADDEGVDETDPASAFGQFGEARFSMLQELQRVPGMTGAIYRAVAPSLTVYSEQPTPDADAARPAVREAMARSQNREFDADAPAARLDAWPPQPPGLLRILREGTFTPRSMVDVFTVHSEGRSAGGAVFVREAVVALEYGGDRPYLVRAWRQGRRVLFARPGEPVY